MSKRPQSLETTLVTIELLRRIPRKRRITAVQLHQQLLNAGVERDLRTIQRQLDMLTEHFDIERDERSKPYGYRWKEHASGLSLPVLSEQESLLLLLAEQQLRNLLPSRLMKSMEGFFQQARSNFETTSPEKPAQRWLRKVCVVSATQPLLPPKIDPDIFESVSNALYADVWLDIEYRNAAGQHKCASVMPLGLAQQGVRLYLVCRYAGYDNERTLALHRIASARMTDRTFERPSDFDLEQYDAEGNMGMGNGQHICLSFCIDSDAGRHLRESPLSHDQQIVEHDGCMDVSATLVDTEQLQWWLNGFGNKIRNIRREPAYPTLLRHKLSSP
ncbi:YafY family protein [Duganella sp. FT27W]|uniref:helix-turn-helix transcriptional regulator n=1 Tax=Duganella sp. FT27W TaxID=2654636 RepID=UPI00128E5EBB|nr:WYL domain-containing protein [Duganella sp. FT27W]MPQ60136.1 WYL domain-containing protein [Duganella sp. FT27W]